MLKDVKRPNGTTKRVQVIKAIRGGVSSMGTPYTKGQAIVHLSSSRCTGETWVFLLSELAEVVKAPVGRWASPKKWSTSLMDEWHEDNCWLLKMHGGPCPLGKRAGPNWNEVCGEQP